jgi:hypothetical protein
MRSDSAKDLLLTIAVAVGVCGLLPLGGVIRGAVAPVMRGPEALTRADRERMEHSASASLFGELRGGMADYLWIKAERVLHNGVEMRALTAGEQKDPLRWRVEHVHDEGAHGEHHDEIGKTTVVPNRAADRRGILGDLERQIHPYMDIRNHRHRDEGDTAALFRLMTWANPHFIEGWVVGADVLGGAMHRPKEALAFLKEGEAQNPDSVEIQTEVGRYLLYHFRDGANAERHFRRAIALGQAGRRLSEDEKDAWEGAHRWLFIRCQRALRHREAVAIARTAIRRFPQSLYFRRALQRELAVSGASR